MQSRSFSLVVCAGFLLALVMLTPVRAHADGIKDISITSDGPVPINEGDGFQLKFTVTNNTNDTLTLGNLNANVVKHMGDATDMAIKDKITGSCVEHPELMGKNTGKNTCKLIFKFTTGNDAPEGVAPDGIDTVRASASAGNTLVTAEGTITVQDVPLKTTPEPSTYLLFGTGLVSMAGMIRRKLRM